MDFYFRALLSVEVNRMPRFLFVPQHRALLILLIAVMASYAVSHDESIGIWAGIGTLIIVYIKARLVIFDFMELRCAPRRWRFGFEAGVLFLSCLFLGIYIEA